MALIEKKNEFDSGPNACRSYFPIKKQNFGRRLSAPSDNETEARVNAGGITCWEGLTALEGSNPSLRKQPISRQKLVTRLERRDRHECGWNYMSSEVAGSNPAGPHREMRP